MITCRRCFGPMLVDDDPYQRAGTSLAYVCLHCGTSTIHVEPLPRVHPMLLASEAQKTLCVNGHDRRLVGTTHRGTCNACENHARRGKRAARRFAEGQQ